MKAAIVGGGVMGELIARSLLDRNIITRDELIVSEILAERRDFLKTKYRIKVTERSPDAVAGADLVILSVKPQNAAQTMAEMKNKIHPEAMVVSIMAGVTLEAIQKGLAHQCVTRSMPNIPAQIGKGMTLWMAAADVPDLKLLLAKVVFQTFGKEIRVPTNDQVDAATAISGSGPAYIFYFAEKLIESAQGLGFSAEESTQMVRQTFQGAMEMWEQTGLSPQELRRMVTSKKGTTEAAITRFEELKTGEIFNTAVLAAYHRAQELGKEVSG